MGSEDRTEAAGLDPARLRRLALGAFAAVVAALLLLAGLAWTTMLVGDAVRVYVKGESLWSKAQKEMVIALDEYGRTGETSAWRRYREAVKVPLGVRQARRALQADPPDLESARSGFRQGGLEGSEIDRTIIAFRWLEDWGPMHRSIGLWSRGDSLLAELRTQAHRLRRQWRSTPPDTAMVRRSLTRIRVLNHELGRTEREFTEAVTQVAARVRFWSVLAIAVLVVLLVVGIGGLVRWLYVVVRRRERALRKSEERYRGLFEDSRDVVYVTDSDGSIVDVNPAGEELFGYPPAELRQMQATGFYDDPTDRRRFQEAIEKQGYVEDFEVQLETREGEVRDCLLTATVRTDEDGEITGYRGVIRDITERKEFERELKHQALHDQLTGLPNRTLFRDRLRHALHRAQRADAGCAVLLLDLDRFKRVNDSFGHPTGDRILRSVAERLRGSLREEDTVARVGGDEFAVLLEKVDSESDIDRAVTRIHAVFQAPFDVEETRFSLSASIGAAHTGLGFDDPEDLIRLADAAMYRVKRPDSTDFHIFDPHRDQKVTERLQRESALERAIEEDQMLVHFQPLYDLATGRIGGAEGLVRWEHPDRGLIPPDEFIPLAEDTGLILPLGDLVLDQVLRWYRRWHGEGLIGEEPFRLSVNLSARQYEETDLVEDLAERAGEAGVRLSGLMVEVTETVAMTGPDKFQSLREEGLMVAIDDFGTGYSSLDYLRHFNADVLKLDRTFVDRLTAPDRTAELVQGILDVADRMGMEVTAEGIETEEQLELLRQFGCPFGQGYLFAKPMLARAFAELLRSSPGER